MDWEAVKPQLDAKLDPANVKSRSQAGRSLSYIEGWHAIAEANRIFGHGAWDRETLELKLLGEPRQTGDKWRVEYLARVRITVGGVVRDGSGFGQGIDKDVGQAHESALKEAETDAMKRALMTFGNPFGLALYDKSGSNVGRDQEPPKPPAPEETRDRIKAAIEARRTLPDLRKLWDHDATAKALDGLPEPMRLEVTSAYSKRFDMLGGNNAQAPGEAA